MHNIKFPHHYHTLSSPALISARLPYYTGRARAPRVSQAHSTGVCLCIRPAANLQSCPALSRLPCKPWQQTCMSMLTHWQHVVSVQAPPTSHLIGWWEWIPLTYSYSIRLFVARRNRRSWMGWCLTANESK